MEGLMREYMRFKYLVTIAAILTAICGCTCALAGCDASEKYEDATRQHVIAYKDNGEVLGEWEGEMTSSYYYGDGLMKVNLSIFDDGILEKKVTFVCRSLLWESYD